jgi:restriction endonuclease S subunit
MISGKMYRFRTRPDEVSPRYLVAFLQSEVAAAAIDGMKTGGSESGLNLTHERFRQLLVPIAPLAEQQRIVGLLDDAFEGLATAKANAEKNLQNARALFESHLQSVFTRRGKGWVNRRLGDVLRTGAGGTPLKSKKEYYESGTIPWLMSGEVSQGEITSATKFITAKGLENSSARMFPPETVLVAMYGATAGAVGILRFESSTNQAVCGILPCDMFVPEFLFYVLLAKRRELVDQATGNAQPNISQVKIKNTAIPVIPLAEQKQIVTTLNALTEETQRLDRLYERKLSALEALKKSLLHQAFTGEL